MPIDVSVLDGVIQKTIGTVEGSKEQLFEFAQNAREEHASLQREIERIRQEIANVITKVDQLEIKSHHARVRLATVSKDFQSYTEDDIRVAYEEANVVLIELSLAREREKNMRRRRDELERRLRSLEETILKAEGLITQMSVVLGYLTGDLSQVEKVLETAKERQLMGLRIIQAQEEERKRVAREIHDGPAQLMANVMLRTDIVERMLRNQQLAEAIAELQYLKEVVRTSIADVRRIIFDLRPMALDDLGLIPTLQKFIQTLEERTQLHIELVVFGQEVEQDSSFNAGIFRLIQECLNNVVKHADARFVQVKLEFQPTRLFVVVKDDGRGFSPDQVKQTGESFGLIGMRERTQILQGTMEISSAPQQGTKVMFQIPLGGESGK